MDNQKLDYTRYKVIARVDWIEITITTAAKTQAVNIRERGRFTYVRGHGQDGQPLSDARANEPTDRFTIRHQDPKNWRDVAARIARLGTPETARGTPYLVTSTTLAGLEIALDLEAKDATLADLAGVVASLAWFTMSPPHDQARAPTRPEPSDPTRINFRTYRNQGEQSSKPTNLDRLVQKLVEGWQVGIGDQDASRYVHAYVKTSNQEKGERQPCKPRARYENRLRRDMLQQLGNIDTLAFTRLAPFFKFARIAPGSTAQQAQQLQARPLPAWRIDDHGQRTVDRQRIREKDGAPGKRRAGRRAMLPGIEPAADLNERAAKALWNLARSWKADAAKSPQ